MRIEQQGSEAVLWIDYEDYERVGSGTLIGKASDCLRSNNLKTLKIMFREPTRKELEERGPEILLIPHYVVKLMIDDVLWFIENNIEIKTEFYKDNGTKTKKES